MRHSSGFTLVELIVVIAIMAVLISVAVPVYNDHLNETRIVKVMAHYDAAVKAVRSHAALVAMQQSRGASANLPATSAAWIQVIDPDGTAVSPAGGAAYADTVDDANGVIGVTLSDDGSQVTVTRPKYATLSDDGNGGHIHTVISLN